MLEGRLEVFVDLVERLFELLAREGVDLLDRRLRVLDRVEQIFALRFEERVTLGGFLVFLERHHVDRAHGVEARAHLAIDLVFDGEFVRRDDSGMVASAINSSRCTPRSFRQVSRHVLRIGLQLDRRGARVRRGGRVTASSSWRACVQHLIDFGQPGAHLFRLDLQQAVAGFAGIALGIEIDQLVGDVPGSRSRAADFSAAADSICDTQRCDALVHFRDQRFDALQAPTPRERCRSSSVATVARRCEALCAVVIAVLAQAGQLLLAGRRQLLQFRRAFASASGNLDLQLVEPCAPVSRALRRQPLQFLLADVCSARSPARIRDSSCCSSVAGGHGLLFGFALLVFQAIQQGSEVFDLAAQSQDAHFFVAQRLFQFVQHGAARRAARASWKAGLRRAACRR